MEAGLSAAELAGVAMVAIWSRILDGESAADPTESRNPF
jgi:hypothetical protein